MTTRCGRPARAALAAALALAAVAAACSTFEPDDDLDWARFHAALSLWETAGIDSYEYRFRRALGEGPPEWQREFRVRVANGVVVHIEDAATGAPPPAGFTAPTVPGLFAIAEDMLETAHLVTVEYHPRLGYPTLISADPHRDVVDDEFAITARDLS